MEMGHNGDDLFYLSRKAASVLVMWENRPSVVRFSCFWEKQEIPSFMDSLNPLGFE